MSVFTPEQLAWFEAHKNDSRVSEIHWAYSVPIPVAIITTALRLWAKKAGRNGITLDDYLIVLATICIVGECASGLGYGPPHGMGRHVTTVSAHDLRMFRQGDYVLSHFYDVALASVKLAILAFYYRVFVLPIFRRIVIATAVFVLAWVIGITVALALVCRPIAAYWDDRIKGKCMNIVTFTYFTNISNLITDIWIFLLPIPVIWRLHLPRNKKLALVFIFSIGIATCTISCLRLRVVLGHGSPDFTWTSVPLGAYSVLEPLGGLLCNNLPIIYHMIRKMRHPAPASSYRPSERSPSHSHPSYLTSRSKRAPGLPGDDSPNRWLPLPASSSQDELTKDGLGLGGEGITVPRPAVFWNRVETRKMGEKSGDEEGVVGVPLNSIVVEREFSRKVERMGPMGGGDEERIGEGEEKEIGGQRRNVYEMRKR